MQPSSSKGIYILLIIILIVVILSSGINFLRLPVLSSNKGVLTAGDTFFDTQNASLSGKVTKVDGSTITIENKNGVSRQFTAAKFLTVPVVTSSGNLSTPSADLKTLETGKEYTIFLTVQNGGFEVINLMPVLAGSIVPGGNAPAPLPVAATRSAAPVPTPPATDNTPKAPANP